MQIHTLGIDLGKTVFHARCPGFAPFESIELRNADKFRIWIRVSDGIISGTSFARRESPGSDRRFHTALCPNSSPALQRLSCTRLLFVNIGGQFAACARPTALVDDTDAAEQVHFCARHSGLCWRVFRRWSGILEFSVTTCKRISP